MASKNKYELGHRRWISASVRSTDAQLVASLEASEAEARADETKV